MDRPRRRLEGELDFIGTECANTSVVNFAVNLRASAAVRVGAAGNSTESQVLSASEMQLRAQVEPVYAGCVAEVVATADVDDLSTMPGTCVLCRCVVVSACFCVHTQACAYVRVCMRACLPARACLRACVRSCVSPRACLCLSVRVYAHTL